MQHLQSLFLSDDVQINISVSAPPPEGSDDTRERIDSVMKTITDALEVNEGAQFEWGDVSTFKEIAFPPVGAVITIAALPLQVTRYNDSTIVLRPAHPQHSARKVMDMLRKEANNVS
jgi:hypothetical protein